MPTITTTIVARSKCHSTCSRKKYSRSLPWSICRSKAATKYTTSSRTRPAARTTISNSSCIISRNPATSIIGPSNNKQLQPRRHCISRSSPKFSLPNNNNSCRSSRNLSRMPKTAVILTITTTRNLLSQAVTPPKMRWTWSSNTAKS